MKRFTLLLALVVLITIPMFAERVTPETAQSIATTFLRNNGAKSTKLTDLSKEAGFPNLYIFNAKPGFVVMSADDCVQPILGYSLTGEFVAKNMPSNVSGWLQGYNDEIQYAIDNKLSASVETSKQWKDLAEGNAKAAKTTIVVDNLLTTTWDQDPYYNDMCPYDSQAGEYTVTGCVATAMAQIMKYWEHPIHGTGSHSYTDDTYGVQSANFGNTTYNWDNMPNSISSANSDIAQLMYHCGVSVDMDYDIASNGGSAAVTAYVANALKNYFDYQQSTFKYKINYQSSWVSMLKTELNNGRPLQYSGRGSGGGHSFVCCGYDSNNNFYFNWGWSGRNDGFYALDNLVPGSGGSGGAGYSFTQDQGAIFGIQPNTPSINPPTIATTVNGRNVTVTWNAINNAASYKIYRNGNLIASSLTSTNYTDTDLYYGEHTYYVKSVKSDGTMSLRSNVSVANIYFEGPVASDLAVSLSGYNANLSWTAPNSESAILQYGSGNLSGSIGFNGNYAMYWAQRYPVSALTSYAGMAINKVSVYIPYTGTYTLYIYNGNETETSDLMYQTTYSASSTGWKDISITSSVALDYTSDLWVVMYAPQSISYPAAYCSYSGSGVENAAYYSVPGSGWYKLGNNTSWLMKTYISYGTFTYNLYDGTNLVFSGISNTSHTINNITNNTVHQYTVKTNYCGGLSNASNMAGLAVGTASINDNLNLNINDKMTITENSQLTVSGTLSDENADNLILENGAQLINNSTDVQATVKKNITAYTPNGGWYLMASPIAGSITPSTNNGLLANNYDLYTFDQSEQLEWRNYGSQNFTIDNKTGYLYANSGNPTLTFAGTLTANTEATDLVYEDNVTYKGFNLIGNPYPCNTYVTGRSFYVLQETDGVSEFVVGSNPIPPCSAILVQAQGTGESVTFSKTAPTKNEANIAITVTKADTRDHAVVDKAKVTFNPSQRLTKYNLKDESSKLYIPQNGQDLAVACANGESALPVNFKAAKDGTYTISFETESLELDYLHLIDNLTGNDVDLLATPYYTFEAKPTDYASRFNIVFAPICEDADGDNDVFAYVNNGEIVLVETCHGASLQIVDMTGRVIVCGDAARHVSTSGMTPGQYVLRLINGDIVRTQKVVIP